MSRSGRLQMILAEAQLATNEKFWIGFNRYRQDKTFFHLEKISGPHIL